ncbi:MAG: methyl-accepting chemotaxis protein [Aeropyrum sp.]|nr:methyl-accepting chemotaxis protein [Aeropyrum sp.]
MNRIAYILTAALLLAIFTLPAALPLAQIALAAVDVEPAAINFGFTGRELVIDPDQAQDMVALTVLGSGFQSTAALSFWIQQGASVESGPFDFATPVGVYGGDGTAPLKHVQGGWLQAPSITTPPTLIADNPAFPNTPGIYQLYISDGTNTQFLDFRVQDIVPSGGFPQIQIGGVGSPSDTLAVNNNLSPSTTTQDILGAIPVFQPGDTVSFTITGLPPNVTSVQVYLDWIGSPYTGTVSPVGSSYAGSITLPGELPMGVHLIMALIFFNLPATPSDIPAATIAFLPIYIKPKLVSGPFIIQGNAGESINLNIVGLPESTPIGRDYEAIPPSTPGDGNVEVAWMVNEIVGSPNYDWLGTQTLTSPLGTLNITASLESDIALTDRGAFSLFLWDSTSGNYTIEWNGGIFPDQDAIDQIRFAGVVIASLPDVPPTSITYGDSGLAVFIDGRPFPANPYLWPCLSTVRVIVFNTLANASVNVYLGPFLVGQGATNSLGVAVIDIPPEQLVVPGVGGIGFTDDYTFFAVVERGGFYDNIYFDTTSYVNIVPWATSTVIVDGGFYFIDTNNPSRTWAAEGTTFLIQICGLQPYETATILGGSASPDATVADNLGVAYYSEIAPSLGPIGQSFALSISGSVSGTVYEAGVGVPTTAFGLSYNVPELLDIQLSYSISSFNVGYSTAMPGQQLNTAPYNTLLIEANNPATGVPPGLVYELMIGNSSVSFTSTDFVGNTVTIGAPAPSQPGVYSLGIMSLGFDFLQYSNYDAYYLLVSDPLSLQPQIVQLAPEGSDIYAGVGGVLFAAFNFTDNDTILVRSPTIESPVSYPARFTVTSDASLTPTAVDTDGDSVADAWEVPVDATGANLFTAERFFTTATTHTLHMRGGVGGLFTFNINLLPHIVLSSSPFALAGDSVPFSVVAHGLGSDGWYRAVLLDPVTLEPLTDLAGNMFFSDPFQADQEGTLLASGSIPITLGLPLGTVFVVGLQDVETGEFIAFTDIGVVVEAGPHTSFLYSWVLTPLTSVDLEVWFDTTSVLTIPTGFQITSVGAQIELYDLAGNLIFETLAFGKEWYIDGNLLVGAKFLIPIPNFEEAYAGAYAYFTVAKIVVQMVEISDSDTDGVNDTIFALPVTNYILGIVKLGADGGALVNIAAVLDAIADVESKVDSLTVAVNDGFATILLRLDEIDATLMGIEDGVVTLQTQVGELQASVEDLAILIQQTGEAITLQITEEANRVIGEIQNGVITLQGEHAEILDFLDSINATLVSVADGVAELQTTAGTILVSVQDLQTLIGDQTDIILDAINNQTVVLQGDLGQIKASLDALQPVITEVAEGVATMQTTLGEVKTGVDDLLEIGAEVSGVVAENNQLLATITTSVGNIQADVTTLKDLIESGVQVKLDQVLSDLQAIAEQNSQLAGQANEIAQTLAAVQSQTDKITDIQSTLASVAGDVADVKQSTGDLSSKLDDVSTTLGSVESKVDSISDAVGTIQEDLAQVQDQASSASGIAQTWGIVNAVLSLAVLGVAGYLVLQLTRRE